MKRSDFFSEMKKGMFRTVKEISSPFIHEDLEKVDQFIDRVAGIQWFEIGDTDSFKKNDTHHFFMGGGSISLLTLEQKWEAFDTACPTCQTMVQWIAYNKKFSCFVCEKSFSVETKEGELVLAQIPMKIEQGRLYFGLKKDI